MAQRTDYWREFWSCALCAGLNTRDDTPGLDHYEPAQDEREGDPCQSCGATWRQRATVVAVLHGLSSLSGPLSSREHDHSVRGLGISDEVRTAAALARAFDYVNTDLYRFPTLNIVDSSALSERFDFVTCSEVLEHVLPPPERAIANIKELLVAGGFAVLTVPVGESDFKEHYPGIVSWEKVGRSVRWVDQSGRLSQDDAPVFHGGVGDTLELREWDDRSFREAVLTSGFASVEAAPVIPSLGVPAVPRMGVYIARP